MIPDPNDTTTGAERGRLLLDLVELIQTLRAEYRAASTLLSLALEMLREREIEIARLRSRYHEVLDERRRERQRPAA